MPFQHTRRRPGEVRDAIVQVLSDRNGTANVQQITEGVVHLIGDVPPSSVRSYLRLNTPALFARMDRAQYSIAGLDESERAPHRTPLKAPENFVYGRATLAHADHLALDIFFYNWARRLVRVLVPGANVVVASNPLLSFMVAGALSRGGLERRGEIARLVMTMRG